MNRTDSMGVAATRRTRVFLTTATTLALALVLVACSSGASATPSATFDVTCTIHPSMNMMVTVQ